MCLLSRYGDLAIACWICSIVLTGLAVAVGSASRRSMRDGVGVGLGVGFAQAETNRIKQAEPINTLPARDEEVETILNLDALRQE
jgi:hypothetical protein